VIILAIAVNMRFAAIAALFVCSLGAEPWPLERLFSRPFAWGTPPAKAAWSKQGHVLLFLWKAEGRRFISWICTRITRMNSAWRGSRMVDLNLLPDSDPRNPIGDWVVRGGVVVFFVVFGMEKFSSDAGSQWVTLFAQIGAGVWFRYFTVVLEVLGGLLVLIP
jgi:hypothetical protein